METAQLGQLKLNVTNIKSIIIAGQKQEKKVSIQKILFLKRERNEYKKLRKNLY